MFDMSTVHRLVLLATAAFSASVGTAMMTAQAPPAKTLWDGIYTDAQATRGNTVFGSTCTNCHTLGTEGNRPLSGQKFWDSYAQRTVGDLYGFISKNMPNGAGQAGTLSPSTYADLVALILRSNGVPAGTTELVPADVASIAIVSKDGPTELPAGTLVRFVGCLAKGASGWTITNATALVRTEKTGTTPADATLPLGRSQRGAEVRDGPSGRQHRQADVRDRTPDRRRRRRGRQRLNRHARRRHLPVKARQD